MLLFSRHVRQVGREFAAAENAVKTSSSVAPASLMTSEAMSMVLSWWNISAVVLYYGRASHVSSS